MLTIPVHVHGSMSIPKSTTNQNVTIVENSNPLFTECGTTFVGNSELPGMNETQSLNKVIFDNSSESHIVGNAVFVITYSRTNVILFNGPGNDIRVTEIGNPEAFKLTIADGEVNNSLSFKPVSAGYKNRCDINVNVAIIDLDAFGIANSSSIQTLRFDNLNNSDIAGIEFINKISGNNYSNKSNIQLKMNPSNISNVLSPDQWNVQLMNPNAAQAIVLVTISRIHPNNL